MRTYFDTSAFAKILLNEREAEQVRTLWGAASVVFTSRVTYVEARSPVAEAVRSGRLSRADGGGGRAEIDWRWLDVHVVELGASVARLAADAAERHRLRTLDAIQLGSLLAIDDGTTVLVAYDRRLREAARDLGIMVAPALS